MFLCSLFSFGYGNIDRLGNYDAEALEFQLSSFFFFGRKNSKTYPLLLVRRVMT